MRALVVADIHGNWSALEAVGTVPHDAVLCLGDVVGYGPEPAACLRWLRENAAQIVQGNHDRALAEGIPPRCRPDFTWLADAAAGIARRQLADEEKAFLRSLPERLSLTIHDMRVLLVHATPADPLYGYLGPDPDLWRPIVSGLDADLVLVGHTHQPFMLELGGVVILNPGSVGQPKDGDPRASFAVIGDGLPRLERTDYAVEQTTEALREAGIDRAAVRELARLLQTGRVA